ncbi:Tetrathionate response regulatory protein TtrR [Stieleria neptunia]|uniref:Tetrathionate response regulatory protein TtrR n=1 Tax=Stieleria neptunia TaxID=2527979 RepID=A0A518HL85_9BACT|nr:Tetrathionate response regulatory protein TtrR [Stieleria neptunia]
MISDWALDQPRPTDFVDPYFFISHRGLSEITFVSPSVEKVLGYAPNAMAGRSYESFLCQGDPLNDDVAECQHADLSGGGSLHTLRCVRDATGNPRILSVYTVGIAQHEGGPIVRRHHLARDVTESVRRHMQRIQQLESLEHAASQMTDQERAVAERIMQGKMNRVIGRELDISDRTVERRRAAIMKHFHATTLAELISKLAQLELLREWTKTDADTQWKTARNADQVSALAV